MILASKSPRRAEILKHHGADFFICAPDVDELTKCDVLEELPERNAELKCAAVAEIYPDQVVIGADTVILFDNIILGKPADENDAVRILSMLSGRKHKVITGCAVICRQKNFRRVFRCVSEVQFKKLTPEIIADYIRKVNVLDKAGAYAIQEHGDDIIEGFSGSLDNIIGLPMDELDKVLKTI